MDASSKLSLRQNFLSESRRTLHLAIPIIIGNVGQTVITFTDTLMVGRLGAEPLAAAGFSGNLFFVFLIFGIGMLAPAAALVARSFGRQEKEEIAETLRHSVMLVLKLSCLLMALLWLGLPLISRMGQTEKVAELSQSFFAILVASILPSLLYQAYKQFTDGLGFTRVGMYVAIAAIVVNAVGNYVLIYGLPLFGFAWSGLGLNGSAIATLLTRIMMAVAMIVYVHRSRFFESYRKALWSGKVQWQRLGALSRLGVPNGLTYVFEVGAFTFSSVMMGWLGAAPLAAHQIALNLASISFLVTAGVGVASSIRVGFELGQHRREAAQFAGRTAIGLAALYMLVSAVIVYFARRFFASVYTEDLAVVTLAASYLAVAAAFQFFDGVQAVAVGALRGLQDTQWPSILAFIAYWIVGLPLGYYLAFPRNMQGEGIWWGLFVGLFLTAIFLTARFELRVRRMPL